MLTWSCLSLCLHPPLCLLLCLHLPLCLFPFPFFLILLSCLDIVIFFYLSRWIRFIFSFSRLLLLLVSPLLLIFHSFSSIPFLFLPLVLFFYFPFPVSFFYGRFVPPFPDYWWIYLYFAAFITVHLTSSLFFLSSLICFSSSFFSHVFPSLLLFFSRNLPNFTTLFPFLSFLFLLTLLTFISFSLLFLLSFPFLSL